MTSTSDFLATVPLFKSLDAAELLHFGQLVREKSYPKGSVILFEDDPGDALFVVRAGRVKVVLVAEDGREVILGILNVGEHFGELSLIDDQPRSAHVQSTLWRIPRCSFCAATTSESASKPIHPLPGRSSRNFRAACAAPTDRSARSSSSTFRAGSRACCSIPRTKAAVR